MFHPVLGLDALGGSVAFDVSFQALGSAQTTSSLTTTFTGMSIGAAHSTRVVIVVVFYRHATMRVSSMTVGGVSATQRMYSYNGSSDTGDCVVEVWSAAFTTGTTANVVVNVTGADSDLNIATYRQVGSGLSALAVAAEVYGDRATGGGTRSSTSWTMDIPAGCAVIGARTGRNNRFAAATDETWSGVDTTPYDAEGYHNAGSSRDLTCAMKSTGSELENHSIGWSYTNTADLDNTIAITLGRVRGAYRCNAIGLSGGNNDTYQGTMRVGPSDVGTFTMSMLFRPRTDYTPGVSDALVTYFDGGSGSRFSLTWEESVFSLVARNSSNTTVLDVDFNMPAFMALLNVDQPLYPGYFHLLIGIDLSDTAKRFIKVNGYDATSITWNTYTNSTVEFSDATGTFRIGGDGSFKNFGMDLAEFWFDDSYTAYSSLAGKFITATNFPVDLGSTGATPIGTQPLWYLHLDESETLANFFTNAGSETGTFSTSGSLISPQLQPTD